MFGFDANGATRYVIDKKNKLPLIKKPWLRRAGIFGREN